MVLVLFLGLTCESCSDLDISQGSIKASTAAGVRAADPTPMVRITSPPRGSFLSPGPVAVAGQVTPVDVSAPIDTLLVGGALVSVAPDGTFATTVTLTPGLNLLDASATDVRGRRGFTKVGLLAGQWLPMNQPVSGAVGLRINDPALDSVASILEPIAAGFDLSGLTRSPIYDGSLLGGTVTARVDLANPKMTIAPPARIDGAADGLHIEVEARDLSVDVFAQGTLFGLNVGPEQVLVEADAAKVTAVVQVFLEPDREVSVRVVSSTVDFVNFQASFQSSSFLNVIVPLVRGWVQTRVEALIADKIVRLDAALNQQLHEALNPTTPLDLFGVPFLYSALGESVTHDANGLGLVLDLDAPPLQLTQRGAAAPGSYSTPSATPLSATTARGVALIVDDDAVNRTLHSAWAAGVLDAAVADLIAGLSLNGRPLTARDMARFLPEVLVVVPPDAELSFDVEVGLPPLFEVTGSPDLARLSLGEVVLSVYADDGSGPELVLTGALGLRTGVTVFIDNGAVRLSATQLSEVAVDILEQPLVRFDAERLQMILGSVIPLLLSKVVSDVGLAPLPPQVPASKFTGLQALQDGPGSQRLVIEADMIR